MRVLALDVEDVGEGLEVLRPEGGDFLGRGDVRDGGAEVVERGGEEGGSFCVESLRGEEWGELAEHSWVVRVDVEERFEGRRRLQGDQLGIERKEGPRRTCLVLPESFRSTARDRKSVV